MNCNCNQGSPLTLDLSTILARLQSDAHGIAANIGTTDLKVQQVVYHQFADGSWLGSTATDQTENSRTLKGIIGGLPFDYDLKVKLNGDILLATLVVRRPFQVEFRVEVNIRTGEWKTIAPDIHTVATVTVASPLGLAVDWSCIGNCLGSSLFKCFLMCAFSPNIPACLITCAPELALCMSDCFQSSI